MTNLQIYNQAFTEVLGLDVAALDADCTVKQVEKWDSISHIALITALEDAFDIMMDADDIIGFVSYEEGKKVLVKYDIQL